MPLFSWLHKQTIGRPHTRCITAPKRTPRARPLLEALEGRDLPSFSAPVSYAGIAPTAPVVTADINRDGKPDILTLQRNSGSGYVLLNNGNGTFGAAGQFFDGYQLPTALAVGDVNGDGKPDVVLANWAEGDNGYVSSLTVLLGNGNGTFTPLFPNDEVQSIFPGGQITSLALANIYGNGNPDLVATSANGNLYLARNEGNGIFATAQSYPLRAGPGAQSFEVAVGDLNADGKPDIVVSDPREDLVSVLLNSSDGTLGTAQTYSVGGAPAAVAVGDVSGDGKLDIVTANSNGTVSVLLGQGNGTFAPAQSYAIGGPGNSVALADFDQDGRLDIATTGSTEMDVLLNNGNGTFAAYQKVGPAGSAVVAADFNSDGYPDLAQIDASSDNIDVLTNNANGAPTPSFAVAGFPASTTAGVPHAFSVTALNPDGTVDTGYTGTVHFTSSDPHAVLPGNYTFTVADAGAHTFTVALTTAGTQSITATDTVNSSITSSQTGITVNPAAASSLVISGPSTATASASFSITVTAYDAYGNVATGYTGTVKFTSTDTTAKLPSNYTFKASGKGTHTFSGIVLKKKGNQSITITDTLTSSITGTLSVDVS